jgi:sulfur relay (sulfurtransferase) complex TusBCD TusD component (DsrE family)
MKPAPAAMTQVEEAPRGVVLRKLIFFVSIGLEQPQYAARACRFAHTAHLEGLPAEVRLTGEAVLLATRDGYAAIEYPNLKQHMQDVLDASEVLVSLCPVSAERLGVKTEHLVHPKLFFKPLGKVLREVSEGQAELIYIG